MIRRIQLRMKPVVSLSRYRLLNCAMNFITVIRHAGQGAAVARRRPLYAELIYFPVVGGVSFRPFRGALVLK